MTPERWQRIKELYQSAAERSPEERGQYLAEACGPDAGLRQEVERMILHASGEGPLDRPAWDGAALDAGLSAGARLGPYEILEEIGAGGMGKVYKARDTRLHRTVALKTLRPAQLDDPGSRDRLVREARAASALNHPNIVAVYDIGCEGGVDFIAMEYVKGRPLSQLIPPKGFPVASALGYAVEIADALAQAHADGVVHRDLKPANIMVTEPADGSAGRIKLLDFGLARRVRLPEGESAILSVAGEIAGTPAYMSPEQAEGKVATERSDVFSFGAVLYEMLTGRRPFAGDSSAALMAAVLREDPPPLGGLPVELTALVGRCLRKDPARRFQHMDDVRLILDDLRQESASPKPELDPAVRPPKWRKAAWLAAASVVFVAAAENCGGRVGRRMCSTWRTRSRRWK